MAESEYPQTVLATITHKADENRAQLITNLRTAAALVEKSGSDLPEILSIGVTAEEITIQPWQPGAPVQAAQAFEKLMTGPIDRRAYPNPLPDGTDYGISLIAITGTIDGARVQVTAATYRDTPVDGLLGMTEQAVGVLAGLEVPFAEPGNDRVLAETLNSPALLPAVEKKDPDDRSDAADGDVGAADAADPDPACASDGGPEGPAEG